MAQTNSTIAPGKNSVWSRIIEKYDQSEPQRAVT